MGGQHAQSFASRIQWLNILLRWLLIVFDTF